MKRDTQRGIAGRRSNTLWLVFANFRDVGLRKIKDAGGCLPV